MVGQVTECAFADLAVARAFGEDLAAHLQAPGLHQVVFGRVLESAAGFGKAFVDDAQQLGA
jgi:ribosomal protein L18